MLFLLWPNHFIFSGAVSNCLLLFPSSILDTFQLDRGSSSNVTSFCFFILFIFIGFSQQEYWNCLLLAPSVGHVLSEPFSMTCPSWLAYMASSPITSWKIKGEKVQVVTGFILGAPKSVQILTAVMKFRHSPLGRKAMTNLDNILKRKHIFPTKVHLVKAMVFPVVIYGCESWALRKNECQRIDALELWCCRRLLRVPWTARRPN